VKDSASAGIGMGLEFFPLPDPKAPSTCFSDADCGSFGPCGQRFCQNAGPLFYLCATGADCMQGGEDYGPCAPLTYCWSKLSQLNPTPTLCHDDTECGRANDCIRFSHCESDEYLLCSAPGRDCGTGGNGAALGACVLGGPVSTCMNWESCDAGLYAKPAVDIATLPGAADAITAAITGQKPSGKTPSAPALKGAIDHAHDWAVAHPDHKVAVLLATDGFPSECIADPNGDPTGIEGVSATAAAGLAATPSISTFVIGVFASGEEQAPQNLNAIAKAGGTDQAFIVDTGNGSTPTDVEQQFLDDLDTIRGSQLPCEFEIPTPTSGTLGYDKINVVFTSGGSSETLFYSPSANGCDPTTGGWHYDVDPSTGTPHSIVACPASCTELQAASDGHVAIELGCKTLVR
jgi:hypothetical protein